MHSLLKRLPFNDCTQPILSDTLNLKPFKEKTRYIMKIEKFAQPVHHQAIQTLSFDIDLFLNPTSHLSQISDDMEKGFTSVLEKNPEIFAINDKADVGRVIQDFKTLLHPQFRLPWQFTPPFSFL
jgi:hypothetical protein